MYKDIIIIAEVKTTSPFGYRSPDTWDDLFAVANKIGDIISIHTDPRWGGDFELIKKAKSLTNKPILAKGIHATDEEIDRAIKSGADYVLVVGRTPKIHTEQCLIEPFTLDELMTIPNSFKVVWNSRDLDTGGLKKEKFSTARQMFNGWLAQASNITTIHDIEPGADAVLVGTNLPTFSRSLSDS